MKVQPHLIVVVLLIGTITPVARPQLTSLQTLVATSGLATIAANSGNQQQTISSFSLVLV